MQLTKHWAATLDDYAIDLAWSPSGTHLAAASASGPVSVFAATDGARTDLPGHDDGTNCLAWRPTSAASSSRLSSAGAAADQLSTLNPQLSAILATGGQDGAVKFWDAAAGQHVATAALGKAWIEHLAWSPDGTKLAAGAGRALTLLNPDGSVRHAFAPAPKTLAAIAWQPAGGCLAAAYFGGVCLWDADDFIAQKEFAYANGIHALVWSPDNKWLVSGNQDPSVHLWIPETDIELQMSGYETKVKELSFDHTSHWLATGGSNDVCIWDCSGAGPEGREPTMTPHEARVCAVAFQNSHGLLASGSVDGVVRLWSPDRKNPLRATIKTPSAPTRIVWSPDDSLLAVGSEKGAVYVLRCEA